ncbi:MAG: aminotransferase class I/II-fold pyridoxal phosphate-dependent enzyme [Verrucomicrobiae bacterium]|nr:aminotransferase class I/II-fold pyridoxal phosphate-dependent enzyme [Verrucomicrobiae bacterium]
MELKSKIAAHVRDIPRSGIRDFFDIVQKMPDVISLGIGEPDFSTPWSIREAAIFALEKDQTGYTANLGRLKLRREIARYIQRDWQTEYDPESEIIVTVGVSEAMDIALRAILNPGDEVIYHEPCYVSYHPGTLLAHGKPVAVGTSAQNQFVPLASDLRAKITNRTKALILNFPSNPTGATLSEKQLEEIAEVAIQHDLLVLTDEIYAELSYDAPHRSIVSFPGMKKRTLLFHGFSKAWSMTGFRVGFCCGPAVLIEAMMKVHQYSMLCASSISQEAAIEALIGGDSAVQQMKEQYRLRRNFFADALNEMGLECHRPKGAFYVFPSIRSTGMSSYDFAVGLLHEEKVAVVPGTAFGPSGEGFVRCSYCASLQDLEEAARRMSAFVKKAKRK